MSATPMEKAVRFFIKLGLWVIPFLPLYVSASMLFPFITGKNFTFRIIVEILFALWVGLAVWKPEYRPRLTPLFKIVTIFVAIVFLADLFGPNPYRSFFSNYERMEGFMMLVHLYLYFIMLHSVFRKKDWIVFFQSTIIASIIVCYRALLQKLGYQVSLQGGFRVDSTIGNPTYLAAYLLFHIWLLLLVLYRFWRVWWLTALYAGALAFELAILYFTASRGPVLGLVAVFVPFTAALVWFWPRIVSEVGGIGRKSSEIPQGVGPYGGWSLGRKIAAGVLVLSIVIPAFFWLIRTSDFVQSNQALKRLVNYSFTETTIKSRFLIWGMSSKAAFERPLLGWGQENYYLVFQKYFDSGLFAQEPWFDRSHNVVFDWLIHAGFLGLLGYLGMIGTACWTLIQGVRKGMVNAWYGIVLVSLFLTYFLQNLFVFDNLNTYILFFAFLAFSDSFSEGMAAASNEREVRKGSMGTNPGLAIGVGLATLVFVSALLYPLHIKPIKESRALIRALSVPQQGGTLAQMKSAFEEALSYNTFGDTEVREQMSNIARGVISNSSISADDRNAFASLTVNELKKETSGDDKDVKHLLFLGSILMEWATLDPAHTTEAETTLKEAARLSPTKQIIYFPLAQLYLGTGNAQGAIDALRTAWDLDRSYHEAGANYLMVLLLAGRGEEAREVKKEVSIFQLNREVLDRLGRLYRQLNDVESALPVYAHLVLLSPENGEYRAIYAALLGAAGRIEEAIREAEESIRLDPSLKDRVEPMIEVLKQTPH